MISSKTPKLSWLFISLCIGYFPTFGMYSINDAQMNRTYDLEELREVFPTILETQPETIILDSMESQYNNTNGIYKLLSYYQKLSFKQLTPEDSRFIIHKHVITGQWQLTEVYNHFWTKNIKAFPVTEENENNAFQNKLNNRFIKQNTIHKLSKIIDNAKMESKSKNETMKSLTNQNELLMSAITEQRTETAKQTEIQQELKSQLIEKVNKIRDLILTEEKFFKLLKIQNEKLIEKENQIRDIYRTQTELESKLIDKQNEIDNLLQLKLIEKENEIWDFNKTQDELKLKLIEKENQIRDLESKIQKYKTLKGEQNKTHQEKIKLIHIEHRSKILNLRNKHWNEIEKSKEDLKLLEKAKQISNQDLLKYQKLNAKLESKNCALKKQETLLEEMLSQHLQLQEQKENLHQNQSHQELSKSQKLHEKLVSQNVALIQKKIFLEEMINNHETRSKQLLEKLQNFEKKMFETSPTNDCIKLRQSRHQDKKENLYKNESQIENNQEFKITSLEPGVQDFDTYWWNLEIDTISNDNVETTKEELQNYESTSEINDVSFKLDKNENKNNLTNEIILQENEESIKLEEHKSTQNLENKTISQKDDETKMKEKLKKYTKQHILNGKSKEFDFEINNTLYFLETVPEEKTIKLSKEEKQMKKKIDKKQNKILNAIAQILFESEPPLDQNKSWIYNKIIAVRKGEYKTMVNMLLQNLQAQEDEKFLLAIKVCLKNKNTLIAGTDPIYQYESMIMHIGVIHYAQYNSKAIDKTNNFNKIHIDYLTELYVQHKKILDDMLESIEDKKMKTKIICFKEKESLFELQKYKYENSLKMIGIILYGFVNSSEEESKIKENQDLFKLEKHENKNNLPNENILQENQKSVKLEDHEKKQNLEHKITPQKDDETKTKEKLQKNEQLKIVKDLNKQMVKSKKNVLETVSSSAIKNLETKAIKLNKDEKQMKRKICRKQNKILNTIEQILLESMPLTNKKKTFIYNELALVRQNDYKTLVSELLEELQYQEDENMILKIKFCLQNKNTLITNTDFNYQYESMLMHIGASNYAKSVINDLTSYENNNAQYTIHNLKQINDSNCIDDYKREHQNYIAGLIKLYVKHDKIFDDMLESVKDEKIKTKLKCFKQNECLFDSQQYKYEDIFRTTGIIVYGCANDLEEQSIELEKNILKLNENISQEFVKSQTEKLEFANILKESIKLEENEMKQNLENKTNVEIKFLETLTKELDEDLIKLKQQYEEKNGKLHQSVKIKNETILSKIDNKEVDQSRCNNKEKIVINKSISEKQINNNIPQKNDEICFLKTVMKMNKEIETLIKVERCHQKRKEFISTIEKNEKILKESISYL